MGGQSRKLHIRLLGAFSVRTSAGGDATPRGRKAQALLAMLCTGGNGRRTRAWLQAHLWSDSLPSHAAGSLRGSLHDLRTALGQAEDVLTADREALQIDLNQVAVDIYDMSPMEWLSAVTSGAEFMEGLDIPDQEFNAWLTEQRAYFASKPEPPAGRRHAVAAQEDAPKQPIPKAPNWDLSLCVLPLQNRTDDVQNLFIGNGLSDDLVNMFQRLRWLPVVRPPVLPASEINLEAGKSAIAETLGAKYFVDGSISLQNNARVARFQLTDAEEARVVWSDSFFLEEILSGDAVYGAFSEIVGAIESSVARAYQRHVLNSQARNDDYQDQIWRGRWHLARLTREDSDKAHRYLQQAIELKPHSPEALVQMAFWHLWRTWAKRDGGDGLDMADHFAREAMELDPDDGRCFAIVGIAEAWRRNHDMAVVHLQQAIELNPNLAIAHHQMGSALIHADKPEEAKAPLSKAMRYSPRDQLDFAFQTEMAVALARTEEFEEAYVRATRALMMKPNYWYGHLVRMLAADRMQNASRIAEARRAFEKTGIKLTPQAIDWLPFESDDWPNQLRKIIG